MFLCDLIVDFQRQKMLEYLAFKEKEFGNSTSLSWVNYELRQTWSGPSEQEI